MADLDLIHVFEPPAYRLRAFGPPTLAEARRFGKDVVLQLDCGTCVEAGSDPVAWIKANPGRIRSLHLKDWGAGADRGYRVLFGEGDTPWKALLEAAEGPGGAECYLIEQEGSHLPSLETAAQCLANFRKLRPKA